jgi:hypothetical protein
MADREREALRQAAQDYMAAFGQALDAHGIPYGPQQKEADEQLRAALSAPQHSHEAWRPIESAPRDYRHMLKDTTKVLLLVPTRWGKWQHSIACTGAWDDGDFWVIFNADEAVQRVEPTHWMPLPQQPGSGT